MSGSRHLSFDSALSAQAKTVRASKNADFVPANKVGVFWRCGYSRSVGAATCSFSVQRRYDSRN